MADDSIHMVECDVLLGPDGRPILAHPPATTSDADLPLLLGALERSGGGKGLKLDFKDPRAVPPVLQMLRGAAVAEVWLNADVLAGPGGGAPAFNAGEFVRECTAAVPAATLSLGWTVGGTVGGRYTEAMVTEMLQLCSQHALPRVTFAVQAVYASHSPEQMARLLAGNEGYTLTAWGEADGRAVRWAAGLDQRRVYVDLKPPTFRTAALRLGMLLRWWS